MSASVQSVTHSNIRNGTFEGYGDAAVELYEQLLCQIPDGRVSGEVLDVGGRDGRHTSTLRALGASSIITVDPSEVGLQRGLRWGFIDQDTMFRGTLQQRAEQGANPSNLAFVGNILPRLAGDVSFLGALIASVRPEGLVVATSRQAEEHRELHEALSAAARLRRLTHFEPTQKASASGHRFLSVWCAG